MSNDVIGDVAFYRLIYFVSHIFYFKLTLCFTYFKFIIIYAFYMPDIIRIVGAFRTFLCLVRCTGSTHCYRPTKYRATTKIVEMILYM